MRIGELAAASDVSVRSLRYYEEQGLLGSERSSGGQRTYAETAVDRVRLIQQFYAAGLSSKAILVLLPCVYSNVATPAMLERLMAERARIEAQIAELHSTRERLDGLIEVGLAHAS